MHIRIVGLVYCKALQIHIDEDYDEDQYGEIVGCLGLFTTMWNESRVKIREFSFYSLRIRHSPEKEAKLLGTLDDILDERRTEWPKEK